ncbi:hypothetical protein [Mucilaginibacter phyllosphaerae]
MNAQSKQVQKLLQLPANITIDDILTGWGDSLLYHNQEKNLTTLQLTTTTIFMPL